MAKNKRKRTTGGGKSYPILSAAELSALNRYVERHGAEAAATNIGIGVSTLYNAMRPGSGLRPDTIKLIVAKLAPQTNGTAHPGNATIKIEIPLTATDAILLLNACTAHGASPGEWLAKLAIGSLRDGVEYVDTEPGR